VKFRFISERLVPPEHGGFAVVDCCRVLGVSHSGYYRWLRHPASVRETKETALIAEIREVHQKSRRVYGSPRVCDALSKRGRRVNRKTVAKAMRKAGIRAKTAKKFRVSTTDSSHGHPAAPNRVRRDFSADGPNQLWMSDITYIQTGEGFLYLAGVMDAWSRSIVGWSMSESLEATLALDALNMALTRRGSPSGFGSTLTHHSDRGVQYACEAYRDLLDRQGIVASMSRVGDCYDNAMKESFWATLKKELVHDETFATREDARAAIFEWVEVFYQRDRSHSSLGYLSPEAFEAAARQNR
jgi:putative transposase